MFVLRILFSSEKNPSREKYNNARSLIETT